MAKGVPVVANPLPQSEEEAAYHAHQYILEVEMVKHLEAEEVQELTGIKQKFADRKKPHIEARDEHFALAHAWGEVNRLGRKTIQLPNGRQLQWRYASSPGLVYVEEKFLTIVRALLRLKNWPKYLKIEFQKNNIKADLEELQRSSGSLRRYVSLDKPEFFRIS